MSINIFNVCSALFVSPLTNSISVELYKLKACLKLPNHSAPLSNASKLLVQSGFSAQTNSKVQRNLDLSSQPAQTTLSFISSRHY